MAPNPKPVRRPRVACEIGATHVFAAKMAETASRVDVLLSRSIPAGAVVPNLMNPNIVDPSAVRGVLGDALMAAAGKTRDVSLVVPDAAVRIVLLDFDALPEKKAEAEAVVRFRLKRVLPFDVDKAAISYHVTKAANELRLVVAVILQSVLQEYETAVREAGYLPGVVLPFTLAALGNVEDSRPTMTVSVAQGTTTIAIVDEGNLLLYRTLDQDAGLTPETLGEAVYPSMVFFQDTYSRPVQRILLSGIEPVDSAAALLAEETGAEVSEFASPALSEITSPVSRGQLSGVLGALVQ